MIQAESYLKVADNTGAKELMVPLETTATILLLKVYL